MLNVNITNIDITLFLLRFISEERQTHFYVSQSLNYSNTSICKNINAHFVMTKFHPRIYARRTTPFFASGATISVLLVQAIESNMEEGKKIFSREALHKRNIRKIKLPADISLRYKLLFKRSIIALFYIRFFSIRDADNFMWIFTVNISEAYFLQIPTVYGKRLLLVKMCNPRGLFSRCYVAGKSRAKIDFRREQLHFAADALGKACLGGVEAVLRTLQRLGTINKCLREAYVLARGVLRVCGTTRVG